MKVFRKLVSQIFFLSLYISKYFLMYDNLIKYEQNDINPFLKDRIRVINQWCMAK